MLHTVTESTRCRNVADATRPSVGDQDLIRLTAECLRLRNTVEIMDIVIVGRGLDACTFLGREESGKKSSLTYGGSMIQATASYLLA